jgi:hypothetical protein
VDPARNGPRGGAPADSRRRALGRRGPCGGNHHEIGGSACAPGMVCAPGSCACGAAQTDFDRACVNTERDAEHCGGCDVACATNEVCSAGDCTSGCPAGFEECDRACTDVLTDANAAVGHRNTAGVQAARVG